MRIEESSARIAEVNKVNQKCIAKRRAPRYNKAQNQSAGRMRAMFEEERHEQIVQLLKGGRMVSVGEIAKQLFVSEATVRRDLTALERAGVLRRVYGGAVLTGANRDVPLLMRETEAQEAKQRIGRIAAGLVHENDVIILDASSTVYSMIPYLKDFKNVVAITSGLKTALALGERHIKTYLTGGLMIDNSYSMIGGYARDMIETLNADTVFFSCRGVSADGRMTDSSVEECELRKLMFRHTKRRVLMAAHNKIGRDYFYVQGKVSEIDDIISDAPLPACFAQPGPDGRAPQVHIG